MGILYQYSIDNQSIVKQINITHKNLITSINTQNDKLVLIGDQQGQLHSYNEESSQISQIGTNLRFSIRDIVRSNDISNYLVTVDNNKIY